MSKVVEELSIQLLRVLFSNFAQVYLVGKHYFVHLLLEVPNSQPTDVVLLLRLVQVHQPNRRKYLSHLIKPPRVALRGILSLKLLENVLEGKLGLAGDES